MTSSLRDALIQAGVVTEKQARQARSQPRPSATPRRDQPPAPSPVQLAALKAQSAKVARDQELNRKRQEKAVRRARLLEIERLIEEHRLPRLETQDFFSFVDGKKVRRLAIDAARREALLNGQLAVVRYHGFYAVVPGAAADRIRERDPQMIVPHLPAEKPADADEAYKEYVIPDDLIW